MLFHMKRGSLVALVAVLSFASTLLVAQGANPQNPPPQSGQPAPAPAKSTALILGQVVDGSSGQPVAEALVTLTAAGGARGGGPPLQLPAGMPPEAQAMMEAARAAAGSGRSGGPQRVTTGADGRFVFHSLPPGQFQLTVSLTGYSSSLAVNISGANPFGGGSINPSSSPATVVLKEGEFATGVKMRLWKNAVVSGSVQDDGGEPPIGVSVQVARRVMTAGRARYVPATQTRTDDRGVYRIPALVPGDYVVAVPQAPISIPTGLMTGVIESLASVATGGVGGMNSNAMAFVELMGSGINPMQAMAGGVHIGDFTVAASDGSVPLIGADGRLQAYQTLFYPGAPSPVQASVISLKSGEDRTDVNFQLRLISTSRISGTAMGPDGPVANLPIRLVVPGDRQISDSEFDVATAVSKADGTFAFFGVPPGQFLLRANKMPRPEMPASMMADPMVAAMFGGGAKGSPDPLFASTTVNVAGDVDGLVLQLAPGHRASGRFEFESQTGGPAPTAAQLQTMAVMLTPMDGRSISSLFGAGGPDRANAQGEFRTKGYATGKYFLSTSGTGRWQIKSASIGGADVLDAPLEIRDADVAGIVVSFTDRLPQVTGTVRSANETDLSETTVLMFPANHRAWVDSGMNPRRLRTARASRAGAYTIGNVPAGDYVIVAIDRANEGDTQDPAFIERLSRVGTRLTVGADPQTVSLTKAQVGK